MFNRLPKLTANRNHHDDTANLAGHSQDLPNLEKATRNRTSRAFQFIYGMQQFLYLVAIFMLLPLLIYAGLKLFFARTFQDVNADIGSAIGTIVAVHILVIVYIIRLEFQREEKLQIWSEWNISAYQLISNNDQKRGPILIILMLLFYGSLIVLFPISVFFALKFIVLKNFFLITNMDIDIISVIGTVIAVHAAAGFYIYRVYYYGGSGKTMIKNN
ncbi:uncharacterized protein Dwil_GK13232 [Drosophila willistoni]|uniref:Uncharacterized protein n=1 Tax=Drosophila willistoni TaxID=7260 RepID=B4NL79_DROWI|nr:uncharacterized protein LOC6651683 [Drosophila willistoni]EDW84282.1 uncharacterized protein Dwil_GK13232 [Drosophila willistoni]